MTTDNRDRELVTTLHGEQNHALADDGISTLCGRKNIIRTGGPFVDVESCYSCLACLRKLLPERPDLFIGANASKVMTTDNGPAEPIDRLLIEFSQFDADDLSDELCVTDGDIQSVIDGAETIARAAIRERDRRKP